MSQPETAALSEPFPDEHGESPPLQPISGRLAGRVASSLILYPRYRLLWISNLFFFAGVWTQTLMLGWLVFEITHSEFSVAAFTAARLSPMMLGPIAGVLSDRLERPRLLLFASAWAFCAMSTIALLVALDSITFWGLVFGGFCIGLVQSPSQPARFTLVAVFRRPILALTQIWCTSLMLSLSGGLEEDQAFRDRTSGASPA